MFFRVIISLGLVVIVSSQALVPGGTLVGDLDPAFSQLCNSTCTPWETGSVSCSNKTDDLEVTACECSSAMVDAITACAKCIKDNAAQLPNTASAMDSISGQFNQACNVGISAPGPNATATVIGSSSSTATSSSTSLTTSTAPNESSSSSAAGTVTAAPTQATHPSGARPQYSAHVGAVGTVGLVVALLL